MRKQRKDYGLEQNPRGIWHCDFYVAGRRIQRSTHTEDREAAKEWCAAIARDTWREVQLGEKPALTWQDGCADWVKDKRADGKRDIANDRDRAVILGAWLDGRHFHEMHCNPEDRSGINLNTVLDELQKERAFGGSTRNRYRSFIVGVMNHQRDKGYNIPMLKITRRRERHVEQRHLTRDEAPVFLEKLPMHLERPARFSLACGARQSNVMMLRWFKERWHRGELMPHVTEDHAHMIVPAAFSKSGKALRLPLNFDAQAALLDARDCPKHGHAVFVFTYHGRPIEQPYNTAYIRAAREANVEGFTWHGLRHTWTTWHLEEETPVEVVKELGGWSSIEILLKHYAHLIKGRHVEKYAGNVSVQTLLGHTNPDTTKIYIDPRDQKAWVDLKLA